MPNEKFVLRMIPTATLEFFPTAERSTSTHLIAAAIILTSALHIASMYDRRDPFQGLARRGGYVTQ